MLKSQLNGLSEMEKLVGYAAETRNINDVKFLRGEENGTQNMGSNITQDKRT